MFRDFPFSEKLSSQPRNHCRERSLFFSLPDTAVCQCLPLPTYNSQSFNTRYNHYTEYNGEPLYPVQQYHPCSDGTEIMPSGNPLAH